MCAAKWALLEVLFQRLIFAIATVNYGCHHAGLGLALCGRRAYRIVPRPSHRIAKDAAADDRSSQRRRGGSCPAWLGAALPWEAVWLRTYGIRGPCPSRRFLAPAVRRRHLFSFEQSVRCRARCDIMLQAHETHASLPALIGSKAVIFQRSGFWPMGGRPLRNVGMATWLRSQSAVRVHRSLRHAAAGCCVSSMRGPSSRCGIRIGRSIVVRCARRPSPA
jgi:hypothetical protein